MSNISQPIVVVDGQDVSFFANVEDAEKSLEPWWIKSGVGRIYDGKGSLLEAYVETRADDFPFRVANVGKVENVKIRAMIPAVDSTEELKGCLIKFLHAARPRIDGDDLTSASLQVLINMAQKTEEKT